MSLSIASQKSEVKSQKFGTTAILLAAAAFACLAPIAAQSKVIRVPLEYRAPGDGKPTPVLIVQEEPQTQLQAPPEDRHAGGDREETPCQ